MTPQELEGELARRGVTVYTRAGQLRYLAPRGATTEELRAAAAKHRDTLH